MSGKRGKRSGGRGPWFYPALGAAIVFAVAAVAALALRFGPFAAPPAPEARSSVAGKTPQTAPSQAAARTSPAAPAATDENKIAGDAEAATDDPAPGNDSTADNNAAAAGEVVAQAPTGMNISLPEEPDSRQGPRARESEGGGFDFWVLLPIVLAGLLGGLAGAGWFGGRLRREIDAVLRQLVERIARLERLQKEATAESHRLDARPGGGSTPPPAQPSWMRDGGVDPTPSAHGLGIAPPPPRAQPSLEAIAAQYSQLVQGNISRSAFEAFFERLGSAAPADIIDNGRFIQQSAHEDSLLTSVTQGRQALVFPSYAFIANSETQFTTMASAPGAIQHLFDLSKGGGGLLLDRPALYEDRGLGLQLVQKGALRGFQG